MIKINILFPIWYIGLNIFLNEYANNWKLIWQMEKWRYMSFLIGYRYIINQQENSRIDVIKTNIYFLFIRNNTKEKKIHWVEGTHVWYSNLTVCVQKKKAVIINVCSLHSSDIYIYICTVGVNIKPDTCCSSFLSNNRHWSDFNMISNNGLEIYFFFYYRITNPSLQWHCDKIYIISLFSYYLVFYSVNEVKKFTISFILLHDQRLFLCSLPSSFISRRALRSVFFPLIYIYICVRLLLSTNKFFSPFAFQ